MTFCDVSTFFCELGGGIRTYHRAKMDWFASQARHRYVLVYPGRRFRVTAVAPRVVGVEVHGLRTGHGPGGYRLMTDYWGVARVLRDMLPDVVEASDPWIAGPFALIARRFGHLAGVLTSFVHSDPVNAYLRPWARRHPGFIDSNGRVASGAEHLFSRLQNTYAWSLTASQVMHDRLVSLGVRRVFRTPFGVDPAFLEAMPARRRGRTLRVLYVGRLHVEKRFDLVLDALPQLCGIPGVTVTVAGVGPLAARLQQVREPRLSYVGYVGNRDAMKQLLDTHDVLISPGPHETFCLSVIEAMARGVVVAGVLAGATGEHLQRIGSPFGFGPGDTGGMVAAVARAAADDLEPWVERGRDLARQYGTWREAIGRIVRGYAHLVTLGAPR